MTRSIAALKRAGGRAKALWAAAFWLVAWQLGAMALKQEILLVSPVSVLIRLFALMGTADFYLRAAFSSARIFVGLMLGIALGGALGALAARFSAVKQLMAPLVTTVRAIPVVSFIILARVWVSIRGLSAFIAFFICFPVFYTGTLSGIAGADAGLLEMARVFRLSAAKKARDIYAPAAFPYLRAAANVAIGLAWKSGVAAEVIAVPPGSIGAKMYEAKSYYLTSDLLAWTLAIVGMSLLFEAAFRLLLRAAGKRLEGKGE